MIRNAFKVVLIFLSEKAMTVSEYLSGTAKRLIVKDLISKNKNDGAMK